MDRFATGAWLDRPILRLMAGALLGVTLLVVAVALLGRTGEHGTLDPWGRPLGTDFTLLWSAGRMALEGRAAAIYDWPALHEAERLAHASRTIDFFGWHYPPLFLLVAAPLATLPYLPALIAWQVATLGALLAVAWRVLPGRDTLLAALGFPAVYLCVAHGHNAFLTASLFAGGLLCLERRPWLAGLLLGCLAYKPQLGLVVPLALLAGGQWRPLVSGAATVALLAALTILLFGWAPWQAFLDSADHTRRVVVEDGATGWYKIQSIFSWVRASGGGVALAYGMQGAAAAGIAVVTAWLWWARAPFRLRAASLMLGSFLATPYVLDYDMVLVGPALAFVAAHGLQHGFRRWEKTALALVWFVPICARHLAFFAHLPGAFLAVTILFVLVTGRAVRETGYPAFFAIARRSTEGSAA